MAHTPKVFISSTVEDLIPYREQARGAAISAGFLPRMMEDFAAGGKYPPLEECLRRVDECDLLVVIVAYRYGWIPPGQPDGEHKSIAWLECLRAASKPIEVIAFLIDPKKTDWQFDYREEYRIVEAMQKGKDTPELLQQVKQAMHDLEEFKKWLNSRGVRATFEDPHQLYAKVYQSLVEWRERQGDRFRSLPSPADPQAYLNWLREECGFLDIRGLQTGAGKAHRFGIEELYIPLTTVSRIEEGRPAKAEVRQESTRVELQQVLQAPRAAIIGEPGAGKTTFLKRIAFALCQSLQGIVPDAAEKRLGLKTLNFPIFIRLVELAQHIRECEEKKRSDCPNLPTDPQWLVHFLAEKSRSGNWNLEEAFFREKAASDKVIFLLDGLDEAPDRGQRERLAKLVAEAVKAFRSARFVLTSRPRAYVGKAVLEDFPQAQIDPLEPEAVEHYLLRWTQAAYVDAPNKAAEHYQELLNSLHERVEIRRLARNPVMLTALAVVHWNEKRLPEQRADLYDSIITWLLRSREERPGRLSSDQCGERLQQLALTMQLNDGGRLVQIGRRRAAEAIQHYFKEKTKERRIAAADQFLAEEEVDSGVIVGRGNELVFWHLTFQEYLCARALAGKTDEEQRKLVVRAEVLHSADWREVLLLYTGVLCYRQGREKADEFFKRVLDLSDKSRKLANEARCVGLIGAMLRDLQPFKYQIADDRYDQLLERTMAIFDREKAAAIPLKDRLEAAEALGQAGDPRLKQDNMLPIAAGWFDMGAQKTDKKGRNYDKNAWDDESPVHKVELSAYRISRYLVTVEEYRRFIEDGGYGKERYWQEGGFARFKEPANWDEQKEFPNRPVVGVCWYEAMAYADWAGVRLPTEAQWERAARGPGETYHPYPWGDDAPDGENTHSKHNGIGRAAPVGLFPRDCTAEGVTDLGGNVWEWCLDWKDCGYDEASAFYRLSDGAADPLNDESGAFGKVGNQSTRVVRGGSWGSGNDYYYRCANRYDDSPDNRFDDLGFRVVATPQLA